jgi:hypothetical protein
VITVDAWSPCGPEASTSLALWVTITPETKMAAASSAKAPAASS